MDDNRAVSFVTMPDIQEDSTDFKQTTIKKYSEVKQGFTHFREGDVLFAKITPCMENGKSAIARGLESGLGFGTTELHVLRPLAEIENKLIYHFLHQDVFRREAKEHFTGSAGQQRVPVEFIRSHEFKLPPLVEQKRIVEKLESILPRVKKAKERLERIPSILKKFRQSVLASACSGELTADWREGKDFQEPVIEETKSDYSIDTSVFPLAWSKVRLSSIATYQNGFQFKSTMYVPESNNQVVRIGNVKQGMIDINESPVFIDDTYATENQRFEIKPTDIAVTLTGTKYKRDYGYVTIVGNHPKKLFLNQRVATLRVISSEVVMSEFLFLFLQSVYYREVFFANETGNANQGNVGVEALIHPIVALPPLDEQSEILRRTENLFKLADSLTSKFKKTMGNVENIEQSILAQAFRGELVESDPDDEPAEELLKRILEEKTKNGNVREKAGTKRKITS